MPPAIIANVILRNISYGGFGIIAAMRHVINKKPVNILAAVRISCASGRDLLSGIFKFLRDHTNWQLHLVQYDKEFLPETVLTAPQKGIDGIIATFPGTDGTVDALAHSPLPIVLVNVGDDSLARQSHIVSILNDNTAIGNLAATTLLKNGAFASFAYIPMTNEAWDQIRGSTFRKSLEHVGKSCAIFHSDAYPNSPCDDHKRLSGFLSTLPKPTAVYAASDECALKVLAIANAAGISVPKQMVLLGTDNDEFLVSHSNPPTSSILPGHEKMGFRAAKEMDALINGRPNPMDPIYIPPVNVIERASTAPILPVTTLIRRTKAFIETHGCERIGVPDIVDHLGVSRRLAELRFRQIEGISLRRALENQRISEAKRLLKRTNLSVTDIARRCGFSGHNRLCKVFTARVGIPPTQYRVSQLPP